MILKALKSNSFSNLFVVPVAVVVFWLRSLLSPLNYNFVSGEASNILFAPIYRLTKEFAFINSALSAVLVIALALLMQMINSRYQFIRIRTKLPPILFVIIIGGFVGIHTLHPVYFAAIFLLFAISRLFSIFEQSKAYKALFDVGVLLGIGSLFYFNLIIFVPAFLSGTYVLSREIRWREFVILLIGFILPFIFTLSYFFFFDKFDLAIRIFEENISVPISHFVGNLYLQIYLGILILYTILGSFSIVQQYDSKKVSSRKYFTVFFHIFLFSMASFVFVPASSIEMLVLTAIPVTFLISNFLVFMKSRFWSEFFFLILLGVVIAIQLLGNG